MSARRLAEPRGRRLMSGRTFLGRIATFFKYRFREIGRDHFTTQVYSPTKRHSPNIITVHTYVSSRSGKSSVDESGPGGRHAHLPANLRAVPGSHFVRGFAAPY